MARPINSQRAACFAPALLVVAFNLLAARRIASTGLDPTQPQHPVSQSVSQTSHTAISTSSPFHRCIKPARLLAIVASHTTTLRPISCSLPSAFGTTRLSTTHRDRDSFLDSVQVSLPTPLTLAHTYSHLHSYIYCIGRRCDRRLCPNFPTRIIASLARRSFIRRTTSSTSSSSSVF